MSGLQFDWEAVLHRPVLAASGIKQRRMNDGSLSWEALAFTLDDDAILLTVNTDTDELIISQVPAPEGRGWVAVTALGDVVGKRLGWCWVGTNYRGYCDSFTLAFGAVVPDALRPRWTFLGEASSISCYRLEACNG